jgi:choline-phosphate cytidylyltransferase
MTTVITYGTFDLLHYGHIRLLQRAKALGDYLIVGVTADDFDVARGKINVSQPLVERMEAVQATGLADKIIVEEYEGQKIDDIRRYGVDIFTVGSDWRGHFDYLSEYCRVVYLDRTEGISSSDLRSEKGHFRLGLVGDVPFLDKYLRESKFVNGLEVCGVCAKSPERLSRELQDLGVVTSDLDEMLDVADGIYVASVPSNHYAEIKQALSAGKHVLCESPVALSLDQYDELVSLAKANNTVLFEAIKPAYCLAFKRLCLSIKSGGIGDVVSVDAACTSLRDIARIAEGGDAQHVVWGSLFEWGPIAMLPIFELLGTNYDYLSITSRMFDQDPELDMFSRIDFRFGNAVATARVGKGAKTEGSLVVTGTRGYAYVPAPWWKTDSFELRFEDPSDNKRYFYQLEGEGIRNQLAEFKRAATDEGNVIESVSSDVSRAIVGVVSDFVNRKHVNFFGGR